MKYVFCTLFDRNYLFKGLALYDSLLRYCQDFTLWILCMDEVVRPILEKMDLKNVHLIALKDFETEELRKAGKDRSAAEYCWTCTGPLIDYVMQKNESSLVAYIDADLFFYSDPRPIYHEMGDNSILIIQHRYAPQYIAWEKTSGIYNVSMVIFRNDAKGKECLGLWIKQCIEACFLNPEAGQCGDQKYLDDWPERFKEVTVLQHKGGGLAPWNIENYQIQTKEGRIYVDRDPLIFYHFHSLQILDKKILITRPSFPGPIYIRNFLGKQLFVACMGDYVITKQQIDLIYRPYVNALCTTMKMVKELSPGFAHGLRSFTWWEFLYPIRTKRLLSV